MNTQKHLILILAPLRVPVFTLTAPLRDRGIQYVVGAT